MPKERPEWHSEDVLAAEFMLESKDVLAYIYNT